MKLLKEIIKSEKSKFTFICSCVIMCISHIYVYTNMLLNHDSVNYYLTGEDMEYYLGCGRWMLYLVTRISGKQTLTPLIVLISIVSIAMACVLMVDLFEIENYGYIFCLNLIVATFPAVANSFCYMYNADGIFIACFLCVLCVWLLEQKDKWCTVISLVLLIVTCGIYQLYWSMSVALAFMLLVMQFIKNRMEILTVWKKTVRYIFVYGSSILGYLIINKAILTVTQTDASGYAGLNKMMEFEGLIQLVYTCVNSVLQVLEFYFVRGSFIESGYMVAANCLLVLFGAYCLIKGLRGRKGIERALAVGLICIAPVILNNVSVAGKGYLHAVMMMPFVIPYLALIACLQDMQLKAVRNKRWLNRMIVLIILFVAYNNLMTTNKIYARQELNYESTYGYLNRMLMRIEEVDEYIDNPKIKVCFLNETPNEKFHVNILPENYSLKQGIFDECDNMVGTNNRTMIKNIKDIYDFYDIFLGVSLERVSDEEYNQIGSSEEFREMTNYPAQGSIRVINDILTIKLTDK